MSFTKEKKWKICSYLLEKIANNDGEYVQKTSVTFSVSANTIYRYLRDLLNEGIIIQKETRKKGQCNYELKEYWNPTLYYDTKNVLSEETIYSKDIFPLLKDLVSEKAIRIWDYAFTEMMNNAIEHSQAKLITCTVVQTYFSTKVYIIDDGIGIFEKIKQYYLKELNKKITLDEAVSELFPGKFTTDRSNHSGEGIFFTSRAVDYFGIISDNKFFSHTRYNDYYFDDLEKLIGEGNIFEGGTIVCMEVLNNTSKELRDIMDKYSNQDRGFYKTSIPLVEIFPNGNPVSRSEAKRLGSLLERFEEGLLDFKNIETVGQGFTHELFVVFQKNHPDVVINYENANDNVERMIQRVLITDKKSNKDSDMIITANDIKTNVVVANDNHFNEFDDEIYI